MRRTTATLRRNVLTTAESPLELAHGCVSCTIRDDLLSYLRRLHRRRDVGRIVVHLAPWLEPEPICLAINEVDVQLDSDGARGPAACDVEIAAVITCVDASQWLEQALGEEDLPDGRTVAQVVTSQAEFADVLLLSEPRPTVLAVLRRLAPRARIVTAPDQLGRVLAHLDDGARRGRSDDPHGPLLLGAPPLDADGPVTIVEFGSRRPFHPQRLHAAIDLLLDGVVRTRGRVWLSTQPDHAMWLESAGGGLQVSPAGKWLAAMTESEAASVDPQRRALANLLWDNDFGDRHTSMTMLVCGAEPDLFLDALHGALLTSDEMAAPARWPRHHDPISAWHQEPCDDDSAIAAELSIDRPEGGVQ